MFTPVQFAQASTSSTSYTSTSSLPKVSTAQDVFAPQFGMALVSKRFKPVEGSTGLSIHLDKKGRLTIKSSGVQTTIVGKMPYDTREMLHTFLPDGTLKGAFPVELSEGLEVQPRTGHYIQERNRCWLVVEDHKTHQQSLVRLPDNFNPTKYSAQKRPTSKVIGSGSREHLTLKTFDGKHFILTDKDSPNGTLVQFTRNAPWVNIKRAPHDECRGVPVNINTNVRIGNNTFMVGDLWAL